MGAVYDCALSATDQAVMIALADHADHNGEHAYPGVGLLAWKTGLAERTVQDALARLRAVGALIVANRGGLRGGRGRATEYRIDLSVLPRKAPRKKPAAAAPFGEPAERVRSDDSNTVRSDDTKRMRPPAPQPSPEPSIEPFPPGDAAASEPGERTNDDASAVVGAYAAGRKAAGLEPCDRRGRQILGHNAKRYLAGPTDPCITGAPWYDPERERAYRLAAAIEAARSAGEQGRNPGFLSDWLRERSALLAREHHEEQGRGRRSESGELRRLDLAI